MSAPLSADALEAYFQTHPIPEGLQLDAGTRIVDPKTFLATQLHLYRIYGDGMQGRLCRDRLLRAKELMEAAG